MTECQWGTTRALYQVANRDIIDLLRSRVHSIKQRPENSNSSDKLDRGDVDLL